MKRRFFLAGLLLAPWAAVAAAGAFLQACGSDATPLPIGGGGGTCDGVSATTDIHVHPTCISAAVLASPAPTNMIQLEIGSTGHTHSITLTAAQVVSIDGGANVVVTSSLNGHTHQVQFN